MKQVLSRSLSYHISTLTSNILNVLNDFDFSTDEYFTTQFNTLKANNTLLTEALTQVTAKSKLSGIDEKRNRVFRALFHEAKTKMLWPDETITEAATTLFNLVNHFGIKIVHMAYNRKSALINALLQDFKKPKYTEAMALLPGYSTLVKHLNTAQDEFEKARSQQLDIRLEEQKWPNATQLKLRITKQINTEIMVYLSAMALAKPTVYGRIYEVLNQHIENSNGYTRNRIKRSIQKEETASLTKDSLSHLVKASELS